MLKNLLLSVSVVMVLGCATTQQLTSTTSTEIDIDQSLTEKTVTLAKIKKHIHFLASDEMAGRNTPSKEQEIAARYLSSELMTLGVQKAPGMDSYLQQVPLMNISAPTSGTITFDDSSSLEINQQFILLTGTDLDTTTEVVFLERGTAEDYEGKEVEGKIIITRCGYADETGARQWLTSASKKRALADEMGALGLIEIYANSEVPFDLLVNYLGGTRTELQSDKTENDLLHLWINTQNSALIENILAGKQKNITLDIEGPNIDLFEASNVIGVLPGADPVLKDEFIIYSAHYDHIGIGRPIENDSIYNGARDNAVGSTTVLCAAENISKYPTRRSALFIFFTAEEKGLLGSKYYVDHPVIPLDRMAYCFNSDNAGYNDTTRASIFGLDRTTAQPMMEKACAAFGIEAKPDSAPEQNLFDRSDNVNFAAKGVPAPTFSMGFTSFDDRIFKYYHQPGDDPASLDYNYLQKFFKSYVYSCRIIANTDEPLFWIPGDKYYDAGVELYGGPKE